MTPPAPKPSVRVIEELRGLMEKARTTRPDIDTLARIRAFAELSDAAVQKLPALIAIAEAAREHVETLSSTQSLGANTGPWNRLMDALEALDATGGGHG